MNLFDLQSRKVVISPEALLIPEFGILWDRDTSDDKEIAYAELSFVYFVTDYKSVYRSGISESEVHAVVAKDFLKDEAYEPCPQVRAAMDKYMILQQTPSMRLLSASLSTTDRLTSYLKYVDLTERDANDRPIYKPSDITNALKSIGAIVESLNKVRAQVEKELQTAATLRGQRLKGNREDPPK